MLANKNTFLTVIVLFLPVLILCASFTASSQTLPADKIAAVTQTLGSLGRYMENDTEGGCKAIDNFPGWEGFPLKKCTYSQPDKVSTQKKATVVMLNPEKEILARWIVASCVIVKGMPTPNTNAAFDKCTKKLKGTIISASGAQFPVAGIVLEDQYPQSTATCPNCKPDGVQEVYIFRDGLTVEVEGGLKAAFTGAFGASEIEIALDTARKITTAKKYARIQSTSREEYKAYMGNLAEKVEGANSLNWVPVIKKLYQDAWKRSHDSALPETVEKYRNDLMVATCYALAGITPPAR